MYGLGNSLRDIQDYISEMYDTETSTHILSDITDRVVPKVKQWSLRVGILYCMELTRCTLKSGKRGKSSTKHFITSRASIRKVVMKYCVSISLRAKELTSGLQVQTGLNNRGVLQTLN